MSIDREAFHGGTLPQHEAIRAGSRILWVSGMTFWEYDTVLQGRTRNMMSGAQEKANWLHGTCDKRERAREREIVKIAAVAGNLEMAPMYAVKLTFVSNMPWTRVLFQWTTFGTRVISDADAAITSFAGRLDGQCPHARSIFDHG